MDNDAKIANCLICTLAPIMKDCKHCEFNVGLPFRHIKEQALSADCSLRVEELRERFILDIQERNLVI